MTVDDLEQALEDIGSKLYEATSKECDAQDIPLDIRIDLAHMVLETFRNYRRGLRGARRLIPEPVRTRSAEDSPGFAWDYPRARKKLPAPGAFGEGGDYDRARKIAAGEKLTDEELVAEAEKHNELERRKFKESVISKRKAKELRGDK